MAAKNLEQLLFEGKRNPALFGLVVMDCVTIETGFKNFKVRLKVVVVEVAFLDFEIKRKFKALSL